MYGGGVYAGVVLGGVYVGVVLGGVYGGGVSAGGVSVAAQWATPRLPEHVSPEAKK